MKTIFITGSTDGIGKLTAIKLANSGHSIYVHGRNPEKLLRTVTEIKEITNNENIIGFVGDFSDFNSVQEMTSKIKQEVSKIDVLINNAGIFKSPATHNKDGIDIRFAVNYLAPFLLTEELITLLQKSKAPRIINLSSAAQSVVSLDALSGKSHLSEQEAYAQSKLALTMWTTKLAKEFNNINIIAVNPGSLLNTKMVKEAYGNHWSPAEKGVDILFDLATSDKYSNDSGKYFDNDKGFFSKAHGDAYDQNKIDQLISITNSILTK
ncbi:NAD(P)-dependent dehydrogenase, short-chain alcohol dehydrogenase family [Aquimarina amphilecti]|uniref:NAD(P)-dependent dehydrogenase, short-chain alcohol dehydrogenase family n=1 Tax=Aquimarina amphilecti TaxID=1038014 RepID=A0A1H7TDM5_AQUAM|nr:SDR family NAD(P)-dependent oxidoreductase [Aquimarina amphilecti]SEL82950.1 NAD(P)-dependent dehydrogenase, short-chain alcohol dehydrogenase family [Aquimarina amphilecti]